MKPAYALIGITLAAALFGCQHPENYRWSGSAQFVTGPEVSEAIAEADAITGSDWNRPNLMVYSYPTPPKDAPPALTVKDFSDRGQATLIDRLTRKGAKPDDIRAAVAKPIKTAPSGTSDPIITGKKELYQFDRTLVATVTKGTTERPGDRLIWTWVLVKPINFVFTGYTVVATNNQTLNIENVQNQTTAQVQGQLSANVPGSATLNPSVSGSLSNQYTTSATINQQYEQLGVDILPTFLRVYQESERNQDVAGNTIIKVSALADPTLLVAPVGSTGILEGSNLKITKAGKPLAPKAASLDMELIKTPLNCPLRAKARLIYEIRRIVGNERSYVEGEQKVAIEQHATPWREFDVVRLEDVAPAAFGISNQNGINIFAKTQGGIRLPLAFSDYETARAMALWMNDEHATSIGKGIQLSLGGSPLGSPYPLLHAELIRDHRSPEERKRICDAQRLPDTAGQL